MIAAAHASNYGVYGARKIWLTLNRERPVGAPPIAPPADDIEGSAGDEEPETDSQPKLQSGTLFERMSNIARGAAKAQVEEEPQPVRPARDAVDIPRFLNRQNNQ